MIFEIFKANKSDEAYGNTSQCSLSVSGVFLTPNFTENPDKSHVVWGGSSHI